MAVYSRFGGRVEIVSGDVEKGEVDFWTSTEEGERHRFWQTFIAEVKADGGLTEIAENIQRANEREYPADERELEHLQSPEYGNDDDSAPPDPSAIYKW